MDNDVACQKRHDDATEVQYRESQFFAASQCIAGSDEDVEDLNGRKKSPDRHIDEETLVRNFFVQNEKRLEKKEEKESAVDPGDGFNRGPVGKIACPNHDQDGNQPEIDDFDMSGGDFVEHRAPEQYPASQSVLGLVNSCRLTAYACGGFGLGNGGSGIGSIKLRVEAEELVA